MSRRHLACLIVLALTPLSAAAQDAAQQPTSGPMIFEPVHNGWLIAPDAKVTEVDRRTSEIVGAYGGRIFDNTWIVGGAGYWMANPSHDRDLAYGGLVVQWLAWTSAPLGFSIKGLVGGGGTSLTQTITPVVRPFDRDDRRDVITGRSVSIRTHQAFFVAEPEADLLIRLTRHMRLTVGAGYRVVAADRGGDSQLRGPVGTLGLQIGGGS